MQTVTKAELLSRKKEFLEKMKNEIFIYPTDTIYGIGCDATNIELVRKLRIIKKRFDTPFSVIVPNKKWIYLNCEVSKEAEIHLNYLPGPYTIILPLNNMDAVSKDTINDFDSLGVRIPDHWIAELVEELGKPIITTSANEQGKDFMTKPEMLSSHLKNNVGFLIDDGEIEGKPSKVIKVTNKGKEVLRV